MGYGDAVLATAAGSAVFALVVAVSAVGLGGLVPDPNLVAVPIGIGVGMAAMTATYIGLGTDPADREYWIAFASGTFGVTFLGVFLVGLLTGGTVTFALGVGTAAGALAAVGVSVVSR